jgi:putative ABC transport system permease protein
MKRKPLTTKRIATKNLVRNSFRSICLCFVVFILSFTIFGGAVLSESLKNGLNSLKERLGADIAIVPLEHESDYEGIILSGEPEKFYFDRSIEEQVAKVEGVEAVTSQFYISTLAADCCYVPVQVIGYNPKTDFLIQPWITKAYGKEIEDGQIIVGSDIVVEDSGGLKFFNHVYPVAAQLDKTSTGMDCSVYANMNTIKTFLAGAKEVGLYLNVDIFDADVDNSISAVLIKTKKGYDVDEVATNIRREVSGVGIVKSKSVFTSIANNMDVLLSIIYIITVVLGILAILILTFLFSLITSTRKKEFALLRTLGSTKQNLSKIVITEAVLISITGGILGSIFASLLVFPFSTYIGEQLHLPYLLPEAFDILKILGINFLISFAIGPLSAGYSVIKLSKVDTYISIREGE